MKKGKKMEFEGKKKTSQIKEKMNKKGKNKNSKRKKNIEKLICWEWIEAWKKRKKKIYDSE